MSVQAPVQGLPKNGGQHVLVAGTSTGNTVVFVPINCNLGALNSTTESNIKLIIDQTIRITRLRFLMITNGKDGPTVINYRVDSATPSSASLSYSAGQTGAKDSGALNIIVNAGSAVCWGVDTSASTNGNAIAGWGWVEYEVLASS